MKTLKLIALLALVAATIFQGAMAVGYQRRTKKLQEESALLESHSVKLGALMAEYNDLPAPVAEAAQTALRESGFTNLNCLVWGELDGKMMGFLIRSNGMTVLPHMTLRMSELSLDPASDRKKL